jgi:hypothetical protein
MPFHHQSSIGPQFTVVAITGEAMLDAFAELVEQVGRSSRERGDKRMLVDLRAVQGSLAFTEQFRLGQIVASELRHLQRLASVVPEDKITRTSEKVAISMGMQLRVFTSMEEATQWLCS